MEMAVRVKMQMLSLLSYVHLLNCKYIHTQGKRVKRLPPLIIYLKDEKKFVVTVVSGMHSEATVLSGSERTTKVRKQRQWQVGRRWCPTQPEPLKITAPFLFFTFNFFFIKCRSSLRNIAPRSFIQSLS